KIHPASRDSPRREWVGARHGRRTYDWNERGPTPVMSTRVAGWALQTAVAAAASVLVVSAVGRLLQAVFRHNRAAAAFFHSVRWPTRLVEAAAAIRPAVEEVPARGLAATAAQEAATVFLIAAVCCWALRALGVLESIVLGRFDISHRDNRRARARRTQLEVFRRVIAVGIVIMAAIAALRSFPWGR